MEWEDYKDQKINIFEESNWVKTKIECPICREPIYKNVGMVLTCYPPKYQYKCVKCNWFDTWY